jgi:putative heme iron utilization protein
MDETHNNLLRELVVEHQLLALGVIVDGAPYVGQVPFALRPDGGGLLIHVSRLAKHTRGLGPNAPWSGLLQLGRQHQGDPFQVPRLTLEGQARPLGSEDDDYGAARAAYLAKLPSGAMTFQLGDFTLFDLRVTRGRLVAGFGQTLNLTVQHLREIVETEAEET